MLFSYNGEARWPDEITLSTPPPPPPEAAEAEVVELSEEQQLKLASQQQRADFVRNTGLTNIAAAFGFTSDSPDSISLRATFALAGLAGYQVLWAVVPTLHSPLMAVTNAISGMTAVGGRMLLGHNAETGTSIVPDSRAHWMGAVATALSFINIAGGSCFWKDT